MAIKFEKSVDEQSAEKWHMAHWIKRREQYSKELETLDKELRRLVEDKRQAFEDYLYDIDLQHLQVFVYGRNKNETIEAYCERHASDELKALLKRDADHNEYHKMNREERHRVASFRELVVHEAMFIKKFTDHPKYVNDDSTKAFKVNIKADVLRADVKQRVETVIYTFTNKVQQKLLDVIVASGKYSAKLTHHTFNRGVIEADMQMEFEKGKFLVALSAKSNRSVLGRWFMQYPLTFHNVFSPDQKLTGKSMASEKEVLTHFGAKTWEPPPMPKERHFGNLKIGDILLMDDDTYAMALKSRKDVVTVWHPKTGVRANCTAKNIKKVVARTSGRYESLWHGNRDNPPTHTCYVEGLIKNFKLNVPRKMVPETENFTEQTEVVRKAGFELWLQEEGA